MGLVVGLGLGSALDTADAAKKPLLKTLWAKVDTDGSNLGSKGVTFTTLIDLGTYQINFNRDISKCAYTVSLSDGSQGQLDTRFDTDTPRTVYVESTNSAGSTFEYNSFHLIVNC